MSNYINKLEPHLIDDVFLIDMLEQILTPLISLKDPRWLFNHSDLKTRNVFVDMGSNGKPVYKLADFDKSSVFWNGVRFYNNTHDYQTSVLLTEDDYKYRFDIPKVTEAGKALVGIFGGSTEAGDNLNLTIGNALIQMYTMHNPLPTFKTFDYYTFMYSLMLEEKIYDYVNIHRNSRFFKIFAQMWQEDQINVVMNALAIARRSNTLKEKVKLSFIKKSFLKYKLYLKKDCSFLEDDLELNIPNYPNPKKDGEPLIETVDGHFCIGKCERNNKNSLKTNCATNRYSKKGGIFEYEWDVCNKEL